MSAKFIKADLTRVFSGSALLAIGKWIPLLIAPVALLYAYGKIANIKREVAERRVEQLTVDVARLDKAIAQIELFEAARQQRNADYVRSSQIIAHEPEQVLDLPAPDSVINVLRVDHQDE